MNQTYKEIALSYSSKNLNVFPLQPLSNEPAIPLWEYFATTDMNQINEWWDENPNYNIGIQTGNGLVVIEDKNCKTIKNIPSTMMVSTPNNGFQLYYYVDRKIETKKNLYEDIDVYGENSYVLAPGSQLEDYSYYYALNRSISNANDIVYDFLNGEKNFVLESTDDSSENNITWTSALTISKQQLSGSSDIIEKLLPSGVVLFAAPAKTGKTFFCMQMSNTIANGGNFLGYQCHKGNAYYLAFEDPINNQIERLRNSSYQIEKGYDIEICPPYQNGFNLEEKIINYLHYNPNLKAVIIDTFEKIRENTERTYAIEYKEVTYFHELGLKYHISIVLVMHTIKNTNPENVFANISGSAGTLAAADGLLVMLKNKYNPQNKTLYIEGKNIPTDEIILTQDKQMSFQLLDININTEQIDPDLNLIIRYVISVGKYCGPIEKLGVAAKVEYMNGVHLRNLLDKNKEVLGEFFIKYTIPQRTTHSRLVSLVYFGADTIDDTNDSNDAMTQF
ncbi:MAG: bifunctional DNA primase/polymerase [Erysipelotrichaceae bacterium]|nr:bifunctional DNA primase/polymerase [Erysipelotrichaceae bacterium]